MDLVLRVISGPDKGQEFPVPPGAHVIGRGSKAAMKLSPEDVSWEHAVVSRDGDDYFVENLSALGTWVGDAKVAGKVKLRPRDKIRLTGETVVRIEPVGGGGLLASRAFLGVLLSLAIAMSVAALFFSDFESAGVSSTDDWGNAYRTLTPWMEKQATRGKMPREAIDLFHRAWRAEQSKDYESSVKLWVRLQIVLGSAEKNPRVLEMAAVEKGPPLEPLLRPDPARPATQPTDEQNAGALMQFVNRRLTFASQQTKGGILKKM